ncbi:MAG: rod shape-determining protein MreC, partial [Nitrospinaceae bacterium]
DALIRENQVLQEEVRRLQRVGRLLDYQEREGIKTLVATIVGRDATQWVKAVYIDKGSRDGVRENLAVVTNAGVVGHVVQAGLTSSKVLLMVDRRSAIDSIFQQSRVPGIVVGAGEGICEMKYVPITANVQKGDWVLSSGLGSLFPKGLVVGHVSKVSKSKQGLFQEIEILPNADLARLEEVLVLLS